MLAKSDSDFDERERRAIERIANSSNFPRKELERMFADPPNKSVLNEIESLPFDDKFDILYYLIAIMKADDQVVNKEVVFLQEITFLLGFQLSAIMELYHSVSVNVVSPAEIRTLRKRLRQLIASDEDRRHRPSKK